PHELSGVEAQLSPSAESGADRPFRTNITNGGFVAAYAGVTGRAGAGSIMECFAPNDLPVLTTLAREFAVCNRWFSALPGPTLPNRFFVHAGTAAGYAKSPFQDSAPSFGSILKLLVNLPAVKTATAAPELLHNLFNDA